MNERIKDLREIIELLEGHKMEFNSVILEGLIESLNDEILGLEKSTPRIEELIKRNIAARYSIHKQMIELAEIFNELVELAGYEEEL